MNLKILETSLNLRIETILGKTIKDYKHCEEVGKIQYEQCADIIANVEDMNCDATDYKRYLKEYNAIEALEDYQERGVSCYVKNTLAVEKISSFSKPHFLHVKITGEDKKINLIIFRVLVSDSSIEDFKDRKKQFDKVIKYVDDLEDKDNLILTGDWNHGVINENGIYSKECSRYYFNYQYIVRSLEAIDLTLIPIDGFSYKNYMKIDHLAVSSSIAVEKADYVDLYKDKYAQIGIPDHSCICAEIVI